MTFQNEQDRQKVEKHRIEQSLNFSLRIIHHYIKDCIDLKFGAINEADYDVWARKLLDAEAGRVSLVSAMKRLRREYGFDGFDIEAE